MALPRFWRARDFPYTNASILTNVRVQCLLYALGEYFDSDQTKGSVFLLGARGEKRCLRFDLNRSTRRWVLENTEP